MLHNIRYKYLIVLVLVYVVIIFTGAFVVQTNSSEDRDLLLLDGYDGTVEDSLSFLDGFVDGDEVLEPPSMVDPEQETKKVVKRSVTTPNVPQYMLDVYERLSDKRLHITFDTARSFHSSGLLDSLKHFPSLASEFEKESYSHRLMFNISHFPKGEIVLFAQLRIQTLFHDEEMDLEPEKVKTFSLMEDSPILLSTRYFNPNTELLYSVNVTAVFRKALEQDEKLLQFEMFMPDAFGDALVLDSASTEGPQLLVLSKSVSQEEGKDRVLNRMRRSLEDFNSRTSVKEPQSYKDLERFIDRTRNNSEGGGSPRRPSRMVTRRKRSEDEDEEAEEQSNYIVEELGRIRKGKLKRKKNPCRRKPLHVNFAAINYDQWIIAPPSYEAFECTGRCSFPMSAHLAPTKHAIIQTLMHSLEPKQVSRASCVPIKLAPISILYVDDDGTVTYKYDYEDMVVAECGCR